MAVRGNIVGIDSPEALERALRTAYYLADEGLATAAYLGLALGKPLLLEGAPGVGKTEAAKAIAAVLGRRLIRLQCYEGIDASAALYEWNYPRQMLAIRQAGEESIDIYGETFLIERPMLASLRAPDSTVLLIDEIDRADQEFEAFLLEFLSDFQISIPERGTVRAAERPVVVLTSNRTRDLHEALRRRCVYHWIDYPDRRARGAHRDDAGLKRRRIDRARRRRRGREAAARAAEQGAGHCGSRGLGGSGHAAARARRAVAGCLQALDRRGAEGRGGSHLHLRKARRPDCGGCRVSDEQPLPRAARAFVSFAALLRVNGFAVAPEQTTAFLAAIELLGPRSMEDIRLAGLATLAPPPERRATYDRLFDIHFIGSEAIDQAGAEDEEVVRLQEEGRGEDETLLVDEANESGLAAARSEALVERRFAASATGDALRRLAREAPARLPRRRGHRRMRARRGPWADLRRTLRESVRNDGEVLRLGRLKRRARPRKVLLLIDVSGSMKGRTDDNMKLAHALSHAAPNVEVFTFGTRLTRVTRALRVKRREQALSAAAHLVSDWDGGTRIGDALQAFLAVPRFGSYARGAAVVIVSDGLERGDPSALRDAVAKLSRRAWRLSWLTPLAAGPGFQPQTEALIAIRRFVDDLVDGGSTAAIVSHVLSLGQRKAA